MSFVDRFSLSPLLFSSSFSSSCFLLLFLLLFPPSSRAFDYRLVRLTYPHPLVSLGHLLHLRRLCSRSISDAHIAHICFSTQRLLSALQPLLLPARPPPPSVTMPPRGRPPGRKSGTPSALSGRLQTADVEQTKKTQRGKGRSSKQPPKAASAAAEIRVASTPADVDAANAPKGTPVAGDEESDALPATPLSAVRHDLALPVSWFSKAFFCCLACLHSSLPGLNHCGGKEAAEARPPCHILPFFYFRGSLTNMQEHNSSEQPNGTLSTPGQGPSHLPAENNTVDDTSAVAAEAEAQPSPAPAVQPPNKSRPPNSAPGKSGRADRARHGAGYTAPDVDLDAISYRQLAEDIAAYHVDLDFCNSQLCLDDLTPQEARTLQLRRLDLSHQIRFCEHRKETLRAQRTVSGGRPLDHGPVNGADRGTAPRSTAKRPLPATARDQNGNGADGLQNKRPRTSSEDSVPDAVSVHSNDANTAANGSQVEVLNDIGSDNEAANTSGTNGYYGSLLNTEDGGTASPARMRRLGFWKCRLCVSEKYLTAGPERLPNAPSKWPLKDMGKLMSHYFDLHTEHDPDERCAELGDALDNNRKCFGRRPLRHILPTVASTDQQKAALLSTGFASRGAKRYRIAQSLTARLPSCKTATYLSYCATFAVLQRPSPDLECFVQTGHVTHRFYTWCTCAEYVAVRCGIWMLQQSPNRGDSFQSTAMTNILSQTRRNGGTGIYKTASRVYITSHGI